MQGTLTEHAESKAKDRPCAACHMPLSEGTRDHGFGQVRDAAWLQKKLTVEARATSWRSLQIRLTQRNPAHGFPTGDLFRRLEVGGERVSKAGFVEQRELAHLGRRFVPAATGVGREQVADDRLFDTTSVELDVACAEANGARVRWWVSLQRVAFEGQGSAQDEIESESRLAEGELPCQQLENPNETE